MEPSGESLGMNPGLHPGTRATHKEGLGAVRVPGGLECVLCMQEPRFHSVPCPKEETCENWTDTHRKDE